jgi:dUTP pyrophosphatase
MEGNQIKFCKLHEDAIIPTRGTPNSAGFDLYALKDTTIVGGEGNVIVPTGIKLQLPSGTYGRIAARSGLSVNQHMAVSAGVIDIDYSGEIGVVAFITKVGHQYTIKRGDKFAQLVPEMISYANAEEVSDLSTEGIIVHAGWGSTGR